MATQKELKPPEVVQKRVIVHLGTNNWQSEDEPAPGSGILHEAQHSVLQSLDNTVVYSIFPSTVQKNETFSKDKEHVLIYELDGNIPICESASPVSTRRWHGMSTDEVSFSHTFLSQIVNQCLHHQAFKYCDESMYTKSMYMKSVYIKAMYIESM